MFYNRQFNPSNRKNRFEVTAYISSLDIYYLRKKSWGNTKESFSIKGSEFRERYASLTNE